MAQQPQLISPRTPLGPALTPQSGTDTYPPAAAPHATVVADRALFMRTLRRLHEDLGTQFRIPTVSGKELDLHLLYQQVTSLGGLEAVIAAKKWTEVSAPFQFPGSFTSKSFTLRKMYSRLLHDYEQVYFFRNTGVPPVPPGADGTKIEGGAAMTSSNPAYKRRRLDIPVQGLSAQPPLALPATPPSLMAFRAGFAASGASLLGQAVSGTVDAQFDAGYFVTLHVAGQEFRGALYCPQPGFSPRATLGSGPGSGRAVSGVDSAAGAVPGVATPQFGAAAGPIAAAVGPPAHRKARGVRRNPAKPKQNKTPFNFFSMDARARAKAEHADADQKEISKVVGEMWQRTSGAEKAPYIAAAARDKERYQQALAEYHRSLAGDVGEVDEPEASAGAGPSSGAPSMGAAGGPGGGAGGGIDEEEEELEAPGGPPGAYSFPAAAPPGVAGPGEPGGVGRGLERMSEQEAAEQMGRLRQQPPLAALHTGLAPSPPRQGLLDYAAQQGQGQGQDQGQGQGHGQGHFEAAMAAVPHHLAPFAAPLPAPSSLPSGAVPPPHVASQYAAAALGYGGPGLALGGAGAYRPGPVPGPDEAEGEPEHEEYEDEGTDGEDGL